MQPWVQQGGQELHEKERRYPGDSPMAKAKNPFRILLRPESIEASFLFP